MPSVPTLGPGLHYRRPDQGIAAPEDYPDAPISIVLDRTTPGADLFGVSVAIGGDIPLHSHSMMEFQFVVSGSGLALDADGGEIPITPGGTVLSPAGSAGAHGFRNTGPLPLTLLCVYPSPGGATPDRSPFDLGSGAGSGPRSLYVPPQDLLAVPAPDPGTRAARIIDDSVPGAELYAVLASIPDEVALHHHPACELLFVISGVGLVVDRDGREVAIGPGGVVTCPAGPSGAHRLQNTGSMPLQLLSVFPSPGGVAPARVDVSPA
jgi:mannose-6-phosphate isomerase-like protein (cupin superfamily)